MKVYLILLSFNLIIIENQTYGTQTPNSTTNEPSSPALGNPFIIIVGLMLVYYFLTLLGNRSRNNLTEKVRNNTVNRDRDTIF